MRIKSPTLIIALALIISSVVCHAQSSSDVTGKWQIDIDQSILLLEGASKNKYEDLTSDAKDQLLEGLTNQRFIFNDDFTFSVGSVGGQFFDGTWTLNSNLLELTFPSGATTSQSLAKPNEDDMVLGLTNESSVFSTIYLVKSPN